AARAVGDDAMPLVEQVAVPHRLQRPPHGLDVRRVQRSVRAVEVDPVADALRETVPLVDPAQRGLAADGVELRDAVRLDVGLAGEAELLLDRDLDRQAVAVVAALALDVAPAHG